MPVPAPGGDPAWKSRVGWGCLTADSRFTIIRGALSAAQAAVLDCLELEGLEGDAGAAAEGLRHGAPERAARRDAAHGEATEGLWWCGCVGTRRGLRSRDVSRCLHREFSRRGLRAPRLPEEIQAGDRDPTTRHRARTEPVPARSGPLPDELDRSEEHTSELQSRLHLVCRLLLEKKKRSR